ncbi:MAG TPA: branched-chain amino acid ABC transporter permease [Thermodesulfobacteriota bacterium]|nr:branched-chain amino acid ABC transporter permease [Thermodesulfobacteriota bacterium]
MSKNPILSYFALGSLLTFMILGVVLPTGARSLVIQMMVFSVFAMGYDFSFGFTNQCSLGHSIFFGAGAYGTVLCILKFKLGLIPALVAGMATGLLLAFFLGLICVRLSEAYFVIVTAIIASVFHLLAMDMTWLTGGDDGLTVSVPAISMGSFSFSLYQPVMNYYFVLLFLVLTYLILNRMLKAPLGKIFVSVRENEKRTNFLGYDVFRYKLIAFTVSGLFGALGGALYALTLRYTSADYFSFYWSILPVVWCLIGGTGTLVGCWMGVAIMSLFQYYVSAWFTYYLLIFGVLILVILRVSNKGLLGFLLTERNR